MSYKISILGAGFIGLNLVKRFLQSGHTVSVLDRGTCPNEISHPNLIWHTGSIDEQEVVSAALMHSDCVFYLISSTVPGDDVDVGKELFLNVSQLLQVLELCEKHSVGKFVFFSSSSVYGAQQHFPISEFALPEPISAHGIQKLTMEYYIRLFSRRSETSCVIVRLSNPFGPGQNVYGRQGFISIVIGHIINGTPINIRGTGSDVRDYIYIDDVVDFSEKLLTANSEQLIFNVGSGLGHSLTDVLNVFGGILNRDLPVNYIDCRDSDIPVSVLDITRVSDATQLAPKYNLSRGIEEFLRFHNMIPDSNHY